MSTTFKELSDSLRHALERAARACEDTAITYRRTQASIPDPPENAPLMLCEQLLNGQGFCVMHRDQVHTLIGVTAAAIGDSNDEQERIDSVLAALQVQLRKAGA